MFPTCFLQTGPRGRCFYFAALTVLLCPGRVPTWNSQGIQGPTAPASPHLQHGEGGGLSSPPQEILSWHRNVRKSAPWTGRATLCLPHTSPSVAWQTRWLTIKEEERLHTKRRWPYNAFPLCLTLHQALRWFKNRHILSCSFL